MNNSKRKFISALLAAAMLGAYAGIPAMAADDVVILNENFDGLAGNDANPIGKLIRTQDKQWKPSHPDTIWTSNASQWSGGNSAEEPVALVRSPYGSADNYCAFYYNSFERKDQNTGALTTCWDQLIYNSANQFQSNDISAWLSSLPTI